MGLSVVEQPARWWHNGRSPGPRPSATTSIPGALEQPCDPGTQQHLVVGDQQA
jgi:hypothetical protein